MFLRGVDTLTGDITKIKSIHELKGVQISILANKIATCIISQESKQTIHYIYFFLLCSHYVADLNKKLELCLMIVSVLL